MISFFKRGVATCLALALLFTGSGMAWAQQTGSSPAPSSSQQGAPDGTAPQSTPTAPAGQQGAPPPPPAQEPPPPELKPPSSRSTEPAQPNPNAPVGTAAAPYEKGIGVGASRPAGAVIAPAKQRRTRSLLIKSALVVGGAVAIGTVIGLSNASPSRPAGTH